jgi:GTPase SAR1 family protein
MSVHDSTYVPTYPVHYPMKKATTFNLFSCFDTIGHDSFVADGFIKQNDVYARPRY